MAKIPNEKAEMSREEKIGRLTEEAVEYLKENTDHYKKVLADIVQTLEKLAGKKGWTIHGRVKSGESLKEKILRKGYYKKYEEGGMIIK